MVGLDLDRRPPLVRIEDVIGRGGEVAEPRWLQYVFLMIIDAGADIAVVYCGSVKDDHERGVREELFVLDLDVVYFRPGLFGELATRLMGMGTKWHAVTAIFAPEHLVASVSRLGVRVETLAPEFDPELLVTFASECIGKGLVRFCSAVVSKMDTRTIAAALALKAGDPVETALRSALIAAIWLKYALI